MLGAAAGCPERIEALEKLCRAYWVPLFAYLRREGWNTHEAEDLVQGFFERFLAQDYLRSVRQEKGRFRSFLLACLRHYAANVRRENNTIRRGGRAVRVDLDDPVIGARCERALQSEHSSELIYDSVWAQTIMDKAARRLRDEYVAGGKNALYEEIRPWLARETGSGEYAAVAQRLRISESAIAVAVHRLRQKFREFVRDEVGHTVQSPAEVDDEMRHLFRVLTAT